MANYDAPPPFLAKIINPLLQFAVGTLGIGMNGMRVLAVRGRRSGKVRSVPVNLLVYRGAWYIVSPRGEAQWVRNLRAAGSGELIHARKHEAFQVAEDLADEAKPPIIRAYLERWEGQTKSLFGLGKDATDGQLAAIAPKHPVFRLIPVADHS